VILLVNLEKINRVHFIGIGGISMSGLAEWLVQRGHRVTGSDRAASALTRKLAAMGVKTSVGHTAVEDAAQADLVVYSAAIAPDNPEMVAAQAVGVPHVSRAELLGTMMAQHAYGIGVAGTHGKTTTTAMLATAFMACGADPSVHLGGELPLIGGTTRLGGGEAFICEADEYAYSFLKLSPKYAIITNIEHDHPDIFPTFNDIKKAFEEFVGRLPKDGHLVVNYDDEACMELAKIAPCRVSAFGMEDGEYIPDDFNLQLTIPGRYNMANATAAMAMAHICGLDMKKAAEALAGFTFAKRRFEPVGTTPGGARVISDYAHHPTAVKAVLEAGRDVCKGRVYIIFQPHTYSRTLMFLHEYAKALRGADCAIVPDIWAAREANTGAVHSRTLAELAGAEYEPDFEKIAAKLRCEAGQDDIIICAGAGDNTRLCEMLIKE